MILECKQFVGTFSIQTLPPIAEKVRVQEKSRINLKALMKARQLHASSQSYCYPQHNY